MELAIEEFQNIMEQIEKSKKIKESREIVRNLVKKLDGWEVSADSCSCVRPTNIKPTFAPK